MRRFIFVAVVVASMSGVSDASAALPPSHDNIADAIEIPSLPFTQATDVYYASGELETGGLEPWVCYWPIRTVWYKFTAPTDMNVQADMVGSDHAHVLQLHEGPSPTDLRRVACDVRGGAPTQNPEYARVTVNVTAGTTLYFQAGDHEFGCCAQVFNVYEGEGPPGAADCSDGIDNDSDGTQDGDDTGCLLPPPSDNFGATTATLPFFTSLDMRPTSVQRGEPTYCTDDVSPPLTTAWYSFTPATDTHVSVDSFHSDWVYLWNNFDSSLLVYTGSSFADLTLVTCAGHYLSNQARVVFPATAGTTYHVQLGGRFFQEHSWIAELDIHEYDPAPDADGDGWTDDREDGCGSDPGNPISRPERVDTELHDDDYWDTELNEPLPSGAEAYDCDGDGYIGSLEAEIGTNDQDPCGTNGWPSDLVVGLQPNTLDVQDLASFVAPVRRFDTSPGDSNFDQRWNLSPAPSFGAAINVQDIAAVVTMETGYPLMFGWQRAFGKTCRWNP